jgi:hypothetical protein
MYRKAEIINCTVTQFDYAHLIGQVVDVVSTEVDGSELSIVADREGLLHIVAECDYDEDER